MVTWYHQNIVHGYGLIMFAHLFELEPLLLRVFMMNFRIVSVIFLHSAPLVLGLRSLRVAFRLMSEKVLTVMCRV